MATLTKDPMDTKFYGERIILNVGGIKYETYISTLTAYPTTLLGTMFQERNKALLKPTNENEYFIDRDGYLFRHILQFYRKSKIILPESDPAVTRRDLEDECDYFQIPQNALITAPAIPSHQISPIRKLVVGKLDDFVKALETVMTNVSTTMLKHHFRGFNSTTTMTFAQESYIGGITSIVIKPKLDSLTRSTWKVMSHHGAIGYFLLDQFGENIGNYLSNLMPEVSWELNHKIYGVRERFYEITLTIDYDFNREKTLADSCIAKRNSINRNSFSLC
ncbi:6134_t:CDS:2 [Cetraspora pellucida]|uniref:6134_t:CDS:1 n=1 Tax=Cetraspora pellucida TaxID=1433469 RepID=A0A9N8ZCP3_9GLOM|nr:6134_t:CDS:2 [Cetraspora pellucida]